MLRVKEVLAKRLRKCRDKAGLTQIKAATYCDITENAYQNYELCVHEPRVSILARIAVLYEVSIDYLAGLTDDPAPYPKSSGTVKDVMAKRLRGCREETGLPQIKIAIPCNITERAYQNYELAKQEPKMGILARIARFYGVSMDYLVGLTDDPAPHTRTPE